MKNTEDISFSEIRQILAETAQMQKEDRLAMQEFREAMRKSEEKSAQEMEKFREAMRKSEEKSAQEMQKFQDSIQEFRETVLRDHEKWDQTLAQLADKFEKTNTKLEGFGIVQSEVAEDFCRRSVRTLLERENILVDDVIYNMKLDNKRQYDIVAVNGTEAVIFEIKNKLRYKDIDKLVNIQLPEFKECFPQYKGYKIYGGFGSLVVKDDLENLARKKGLFVLTQGGDGAAELHVPGSRGVW